MNKQSYPYMKKYAKVLTALFLLVGLLSVSGAAVSCKSSSSSSKTMYETKKYSSTKVINRNYKVKGTNKRNGNTYRSY